MVELIVKRCAGLDVHKMSKGLVDNTYAASYTEPKHRRGRQVWKGLRADR